MFNLLKKQDEDNELKNKEKLSNNSIKDRIF